MCPAVPLFIFKQPFASKSVWKLVLSLKYEKKLIRIVRIRRQFSETNPSVEYIYLGLSPATGNRSRMNNVSS